MTSSPQTLAATADTTERLDRCLARLHPEISRARFQRLIAEGQVLVEGQTITDGGVKLKSGQHVLVTLPPPVAAEPLPENIALEVAFEDKHIIVINKPAGLVVHPAAGHEGGTLVNALLAHCGDSLSGIGGVKRPGIGHRSWPQPADLTYPCPNDAQCRGV